VTVSNGKVFHHLDDSEDSWSQPAWHPPGPWRDYQEDENIRIAESRERNAGPPYEAADVSDDAYFDGQIASRSIEDMRRLGRSGKPFFLAVSFKKPHLPFNAPHDGHSVRTDRYLYTEWRDRNGERVARMLFDHQNDPKENINIAEDPGNQSLVLQLAGLLQRGWGAALPPSP
jgi:hypothetical protein